MPNARKEIPVTSIDELPSADGEVAASRKVIQTTCPYCGVGCGVLAQVEQDRMVGVCGDPAHPANYGKLCVKGSSLHETTSLDDRLLVPRVGGQLVDWPRAIAEVAQAITKTRNDFGPDAVAFYVSGQLLTEDYYVANKLMKGFIGAANIDTNSRLCMSSAVVAHKRAFGEDAVPGNYEDIEAADLLLVVGANPAWTHPILYQRRQVAQEKCGHKKMVVIDPRKTATASGADLHLAIRPGTDALFFLGLAKWLLSHNCLDECFIESHCENFKEFVNCLAPWTLEKVSQETALNCEALATVYDWFARTPRTVTFFSQGVNQSNAGVDKGNSIINCHLMTGRVGRLGATPWSITGQPNAMGGREVGGLANQLAAHLDLDNPGHRRLVQDFWQSPVMPEKAGFQAVELFQKIHAGHVKCVWIMATNPVVSLPDREFVREALARCDHVIVSEVVAQTDTLAMADICLPAAAWAEKSGMVTNSERCISRQRQCVPLPGQVKLDWQIICAVAREMGWSAAFNYQHPHEIFNEHAQLTALANQVDANTIEPNAAQVKQNTALNAASHPRMVSVPRSLNLSGLTQLDPVGYADFTPTQWPILEKGKGTARLFSDGKFYTPTGRARFVAVKFRGPHQQPTAEFPFVVNSGRMRDQWHSMTRTARSARLSGHCAEPFAAFHPQDFKRLALDSKHLVRIYGPLGELLLRPKAVAGQQVGEIFLPIHWNECYSANAAAGKLFAQVVDPLSGQPELKHGVAQCEAVTPRWQAVLFSHHRVQSHWLNQWGNYWTSVRLGRGYKIIMAGVGQQPDGDRFFSQLIQHIENTHVPEGVSSEPVDERFTFIDQENRLYRAGIYTDTGLQCGLWLGKNLDTQTGDGFAALFPENDETPAQASVVAPVSRAAIVSQKQPIGGPTICSCWGVTALQIERAIQSGCDSVAQLGQALGCGTGCGTCLPELKASVEAVTSLSAPTLG